MNKIFALEIAIVIVYFAWSLAFSILPVHQLLFDTLLEGLLEQLFAVALISHRKVFSERNTTT